MCARVRTRTLFKCQKRPNNTVKETRLHRQPFSLSLSLSLCLLLAGPYAVTDVAEVVCDNNLTNCDEQMNLVFQPPTDTGGHEILEVCAVSKQN